MQTLIFATNNQHKIEEIRHVLQNRFRIITLAEAGIYTDIPEPHDTLEENAIEKSMVIHRMTGKDCFSEDTGLETEALGGLPGVRSARFAGETADAEANIDKLLSSLKGESNRRARFRTIICLLIGGKTHLFEGVCQGRIAEERKGSSGFGYDAVFVPDGSEKTFGEMNLEEKNSYSHRRKATDKLIAFLKNENDFLKEPS